MQPQASTEENEASGLVLSPEDVSMLLSDSSADARIHITNKIATAYNGTLLSASEVQVAEQIFRLLVRDTEMRVRASLSQHVKDSDRISRDIVMALARDVEEVSLPMLQYSQVLSDTDLVEIIQSTEEISRYMAISQRARVSDVVSGTLIEKGDERIATTLVENPGAEISEAGFERIIHEYRQSEPLMKRLVNRPLIPIATVDKLVTVVSGSLAETLKKKYHMPTEQIDQEIEKTREKETLGLVRMAAGDEAINKLINQLHAYGRLTPSIILSALCQGNFEFFEIGLAHLAGLPVSNARKLISDRGDLGFRGIYNKSGLSESMFPAVKLLLKVVREIDAEGEQPGSSRYSNRVVERLLKHSEGNPVENLSYIIALVRQA